MCDSHKPPREIGWLASGLRRAVAAEETGVMGNSDYLVVERLEAKVEVLRAENARLQEDLATYVKDTEATENRIIDAEFAAQEWQAEVERLKADMAGDQQRLFHYEAENERLRHELSYCPRDHQVADGMIRDLRAEVARLLLEIERLTAALNFYANIETYRGHGMQDAEIIHDGGQQARRALEPKP